MAVKPSDAIVFFGATGDLVYKQIFPALLSLVHDEGLNAGYHFVPGVRAGSTVETFVEPVLDNATPVFPYHPGTWGPEEARALIGADGPWRNPNITAEPFT